MIKLAYDLLNQFKLHLFQFMVLVIIMMVLPESGCKYHYRHGICNASATLSEMVAMSTGGIWLS